MKNYLQFAFQNTEEKKYCSPLIVTNWKHRHIKQKNKLGYKFFASAIYRVDTFSFLYKPSHSSLPHASLQLCPPLMPYIYLPPWSQLTLPPPLTSLPSNQSPFPIYIPYTNLPPTNPPFLIPSLQSINSSIHTPSNQSTEPTLLFFSIPSHHIHLLTPSFPPKLPHLTHFFHRPTN